MKFTKRKRQIAIRKDKEAVTNMYAALYLAELKELLVALNRDIWKYQELLPEDSTGLAKLKKIRATLRDTINKIQDENFNKHHLTEEEIKIYQRFYGSSSE